MPSLADELSELDDNNDYRLRGCSLGILLKQLPLEEQDAVQSAVDDLNKPASKLAQLLQKHGHNINEASIRRHRRLVCRCPR